MKLLVMAFVAQIGAVAGRRGSGRSVRHTEIDPISVEVTLGGKIYFYYFL